MSESRNNGESRNFELGSYSNESRNSSSCYSSYSSYSSESRNNGESRCDYLGYSTSLIENKTKYNELEDIDKLIERLEKSTPTDTHDNPKYNNVLRRRKKTLEQLKELREEAVLKLEENKKLEQLEKENDELEEAVKTLKKIIKNGTTLSKNSTESRDSGESR